MKEEMACLKLEVLKSSQISSSNNCPKSEGRKIIYCLSVTYQTPSVARTRQSTGGVEGAAKGDSGMIRASPSVSVSPLEEL
jgi:hypothetical protein